MRSTKWPPGDLYQHLFLNEDAEFQRGCGINILSEIATIPTGDFRCRLEVNMAGGKYLFHERSLILL